LLVSGLFSRLASGISIATILSFITAEIYLMSSGGGNLPCGCFGELIPLTHTGSLVLGAVMLVAAFPLVFNESGFLTITPVLSARVRVLKRTAAFENARAPLFSGILIATLLVTSAATWAASPKPISAENIMSNAGISFDSEMDDWTMTQRNSSATPTVNSTDTKLEPEIDSSPEIVKPMFLYFYSEGCHYCQQEKPIIDELEGEYGDRMAFIHIEARDNRQKVDQYKVTGVPTVLLIYGEDSEAERQYQRFEGLTTEETLKRNVDDFLQLVSLRE
jgi:thioredoxin 1